MKTLGLVIASYQYGHLAAHALESALSQSVSFDKIWFVDDGVGDCDHLVRFSQYDIVLKIFRKHNLGIIENFNDVLINSVDTDYVIFMGADNWLQSNTCSSIKEVLQTEIPIPDIITYDIMVTGQLKSEIHKFYANDMSTYKGDYHWKRQFKHHGSMAYNVQMAKELNGYAHNKTSQMTDEDLNLWNKMMNARAKVYYIPDTFLYYRRHKENFNKY